MSGHVHCYLVYPSRAAPRHCLIDVSQLAPGDEVNVGGVRYTAVPTMKNDVLDVAQDWTGAQVAAVAPREPSLDPALDREKELVEA